VAYCTHIVQTKLMLKNLRLRIQLPRPLSRTLNAVPFVFIADNSFTLLANIKPFPGQYSQSRQERILNYRLSRAHRVMEKVFGILSARFRVF